MAEVYRQTMLIQISEKFSFYIGTAEHYPGKHFLTYRIGESVDLPVHGKPYHLISLCNVHFHWLKCTLPGKVITASPCPEVQT